MTDRSTLQRHEWLNYSWKKEDYLPSAYYDRLLKPYAAGGREDVELFAEYLQTLAPPGQVLEVGCGTGRATAHCHRAFPRAVHTLLDLSETMIAATRSKFPGATTRFICQDSLAYMRDCNSVYDLVYSLWSFSHSVHQTMERLHDEGGDFSSIEEVLRKFLRTNIRPGGSFYLLHFDSQSEEQTILLRQWAKIHPVYADHAAPSQSFRLVTRVLEQMSRQAFLRYQVEHVAGDPIIYSDLESALEIFVNFHLEGELRGAAWIAGALAEISEYLAGFTTAAGSISIRPAWYIIKIDR